MSILDYEKFTERYLVCLECENVHIAGTGSLFTYLKNIVDDHVKNRVCLEISLYRKVSNDGWLYIYTI